MIDLHSHTDQSDGSVPPAQLVHNAAALGLEALGITDHDILTGYDMAVPYAAESGLELICGVELSTRPEQQPGEKRPPSVHLLGYFVNTPPTAEFREWLLQHQASRRQRNLDLIAKLNSLGVDITLEEVRALGRNLTGRPHFAKILLKKGYVKTNQEAFGIPDPAANAHGIRTTALASSQLLDFIAIDEERVAEEVYWMRREITELVEPVLSGGYLQKEIADAFRTGRLDVPFSASIHARSEVIPRRDENGAIRLLHAGGLPFSPATLRRNEQRLRARKEPKARLIESITRDIDYFKAYDGRRRVPLFARR